MPSNESKAKTTTMVEVLEGDSLTINTHDTSPTVTSQKESQRRGKSRKSLELCYHSATPRVRRKRGGVGVRDHHLMTTGNKVQLEHQRRRPQEPRKARRSQNKSWTYRSKDSTPEES